MAHPCVNSNEFYGGFSSRVFKTVDQPVPKAFRNQSRRSHEPALRKSSSMEEVFNTAASPSPTNAGQLNGTTPSKAGRVSVGSAQGLSASGRKKFDAAASLVFPSAEQDSASPAPLPTSSGRRAVTPPMRSVSPTGRRTFFAQPNSPCNETEFRPPSGGKSHFLEHPNVRDVQVKVVMEPSKSPLNAQPSNTPTRRSADRKGETTIDSDTKYFTFTGGKRCPSPSNDSLLGILRPELPKPAPVFKLKAPFATD
jgi:hypothetical protein